MTNFKEIQISEIFDFPSIKGLTANFISKNIWDIPVYWWRKYETPIWYIKNNLSNVKYFKDCLWWNREWSVWYVFYHKWFFSTNDHHRPLILKKDYYYSINLNYIKNILQILLFEQWFVWSKTASKEKVQELFIKVPLNKHWEFDLEKQKEIALKYEKLEKLKDRIRIMKEDLENQIVSLDNIYNWIDKKITELFFIKQWDAYYTKKRILENNWIWNIPVFSSNTKEEWLLVWIKKEFIKDKDLYYQNCLTWAIDWYAWKIFSRNIDNIDNKKENKFLFTLNNHCWILLPKIDNLYLPFIKILLQPKFFIKAKWYWNNKLWTNQIEDIIIKIPIRENWEFDLEKQKEIAWKYEKIEKIQKTLIEELEYLEKVKVEI